MQQKSNTNVGSNFAASLAVAIRDSRMSNRAFAAAVGLSPAAINNYLTGRIPKLDEAQRIATYLGLTLDELLNGHKNTPGVDAAIWRERAISAEQRLEATKAGLLALVKKI